MKNLLKRLLAGWMAVLLILASDVSAYADVLRDYGGGGTTGTASNEGAYPSPVVQVAMPTRREGMFDFIIDPYGAIALSKAAKYKKLYGDDVTFDSGKLFFQNIQTNEDGTQSVSYSKRSDALIVTNKGSVPLDVKVSLEVDKGDYSFEFANTSDFKDASGNEISGPVMYLALVSNKRTAPVQAVEVEEDGETETHYSSTLNSWVAPPQDAYEIGWNSDTHSYANLLKSGITDDAFKSTAFYLTGAIENAPWNTSEYGTKDITLNVIWDISYTASSYDENPYSVPDTAPAVSVRQGAYLIDDTVALNVDFGSGTTAMPNLTGISYVKADETPGTLAPDAMTVTSLDAFESIVRFTAEGEIFSGSDWKLVLSNDADGSVELPFDLMAPDDGSLDPTVEVETQVKASGGTATLSVDWGTGRRAMSSVSKVTYTKSTGAAGSISGTGTSIKVNGNTITIKLSSTAFQGTDFVLVLANEYGGTFEIPVELIDNTPSPTPSPTSTPTPPPSPTPTPTLAPGTDPVVTVKTQAKASGESAVVNVNWGTGGRAMTSASKVTYTKSTGAAGTISSSSITTSGNTVTIKIAATPFKGNNFVLVLTNDNGGTFEAPVDLVAGTVAPTPTPTSKPVTPTPKAATPTPVPTTAPSPGGSGSVPSLTVNTPAAAVKDTVSMTVNYGNNTGLTRVLQMTYKMSGQTAETVVSAGSTNLQVNGTTVTIKAMTAIFNGSDWRLILADQSGNKTAEIPFNLKAAGTISGAMATVTQPAEAIKDTVTVTVDFGETVSTVKAMTYKMSGQTAKTTVNAGTTNLQVSGTTVTIKAMTAIFNGSDWKLVLTNADETVTINVPIDIKNAD